MRHLAGVALPDPQPERRVFAEEHRPQYGPPIRRPALLPFQREGAPVRRADPHGHRLAADADLVTAATAEIALLRSGSGRLGHQQGREGDLRTPQAQAGTLGHLGAPAPVLEHAHPAGDAAVEHPVRNDLPRRGDGLLEKRKTVPDLIGRGGRAFEAPAGAGELGAPLLLVVALDPVQSPFECELGVVRPGVAQRAVDILHVVRARPAHDHLPVQLEEAAVVAVERQPVDAIDRHGKRPAVDGQEEIIVAQRVL